MANKTSSAPGNFEILKKNKKNKPTNQQTNNQLFSPGKLFTIITCS